MVGLEHYLTVAAALGTSVDPERVPGYAAFHADPLLHEALRQHAREEGVGFVEDPFSAASSDMGDVSRVVPSIIVGLPGTNGKLHQADFRVIDEEAAYGFSGRLLASLVQRVLATKSERAARNSGKNSAPRTSKLSSDGPRMRRSRLTGTVASPSEDMEMAFTGSSGAPATACRMVALTFSHTATASNSAQPGCGRCGSYSS